LPRGEQSPEQHRGGFRRWQNGLRFDPAFELFMQAFDGVGGSDRFPLALREAGEGKQFVAGLLQTVGYGAAFQPPLADKRLAALLHLFLRFSVDHVRVIGRHFLVQSIGCMSEKIPIFVDVMPTSA
jgi:hypothetical protein